MFQDTSLKLDARLPLIHWWQDTPSHAAELTAGFFNTSQRNGYLTVLQTLAHHGVGLHVTGADLRNEAQNPDFACDPEGQIRLLRAAAASMKVSPGLPITRQRSQGSQPELGAGCHCLHVGNVRCSAQPNDKCHPFFERISL